MTQTQEATVNAIGTAAYTTGVLIRWAVVTTLVLVLCSVSVMLMLHYVVCSNKRSARAVHMLRATNNTIKKVSKLYVNY